MLSRQQENPLTEQPSYNRTLGAVRLVSVWALVAALVWWATPTITSVAIGFLFVGLGESVRFWAAGHLLKTKELITCGPYRHTRNPLYLGRLLILTGLAIMTTLPYQLNWVVLAVGYLVFFGYYMPRKERIEPDRLRRTHGEAYEHYFKAVPALFPSFTPYADAGDARWSSERMLRNREQWMVIALLLISGVLLWKAWR